MPGLATTRVTLAAMSCVLAACLEIPLAALEEQALNRAIQRTKDDLSRFAVNPSDITTIGLYPVRGGSGRPILYHIWARSRTCAGWFVQRVDNPPDLFTLYGCSLDRGTETQGR